LHNLPIETIDIDGDEIQVIEDIYKALNEKFNITFPDNFTIDTGQFDSFNHYPEASIGAVWQVNRCYLTFIKIHYIFRVRAATNSDYYRYQLWAFVKLKNDFGRIVIRHESFTDKVLELINPVELDFEDDKAFSSIFYVVTNDKEKAMLAMTWNFRNALMDMQDDWIIEIVNNNLLIYNNSCIDTRDALALTEFAGKIAALR